MRSQIVLAKLIITKKYYVTIRNYAEVNTNITMNDKWKPDIAKIDKMELVIAWAVRLKVVRHLERRRKVLSTGGHN